MYSDRPQNCWDTSVETPASRKCLISSQLHYITNVDYKIAFKTIATRIQSALIKQAFLMEDLLKSYKQFHVYLVFNLKRLSTMK